MFIEAFYDQFDCLQLRCRDNAIYEMSVSKKTSKDSYISWLSVSFNPRVNSSFIISLLGKDLVLQNEWWKKSQHWLSWLPSTTPMFTFCWCFHVAFSGAPQKPLKEKVKLILIRVFAMGYVISWRPCNTVCWLPVSYMWNRHLVPSEWRITRTAHETLISTKLGYFGVSIELFSQHTINESRQFVN